MKVTIVITDAINSATKEGAAPCNGSLRIMMKYVNGFIQISHEIFSACCMRNSTGDKKNNNGKVEPTRGAISLNLAQRMDRDDMVNNKNEKQMSALGIIQSRFTTFSGGNTRLTKKTIKRLCRKLITCFASDTSGKNMSGNRMFCTILASIIRQLVPSIMLLLMNIQTRKPIVIEGTISDFGMFHNSLHKRPSPKDPSARPITIQNGPSNVRLYLASVSVMAM